MAYVKIMYQNSPSTATPINAENLNHMDDQIALNDQRLTEIETSYVKSFNGRKGEVTSQANDYDMSQITPTSGATVGQIPIVRNDGTEEEPNLTFHMEDVPSSGHVIKDQSGTSLPQEENLQFPDSFVSDDETNGRTIVENIKEVSPADYASTTDEGIIVTDDGKMSVKINKNGKEYDLGFVPQSLYDDVEELKEAVFRGSESVTADGVKTWETLLNELRAKIDLTKVTIYSVLTWNGDIYSAMYIDNNTLGFSLSGTSSFISGGTPATVEMLIRSSSSQCFVISGTTATDISSNKPTNGTEIALHY